MTTLTGNDGPSPGSAPAAPAALVQADDVLRYAAGNYYVNDKSTGAAVGQQPFGGARASGTNDKAGTVWNLIRFASPRSVKRTHGPDRGAPFRRAGLGAEQLINERCGSAYDLEHVHAREARGRSAGAGKPPSTTLTTLLTLRNRDPILTSN